MTKWIDEGRPVEADANGGTEEDFKYALNAECVKSYEQMAQIEAEISAGKSGVQIIDVRNEKTYTDGHIPSSSNLFFRNILNEDNTLKSNAEIVSAFTAQGINLSKPIITYCNSGMTASYMMAALQHIGAANTSLYDGSWSEYSVKNKQSK